MSGFQFLWRKIGETLESIFDLLYNYRIGNSYYLSIIGET